MVSSRLEVYLHHFVYIIPPEEVLDNPAGCSIKYIGTISYATTKLES